MASQILSFVILIWFCVAGVYTSAAQDVSAPVPRKISIAIIDDLRLNETSPQDATKLLGQPHKDETGDFGINEKRLFVNFNVKSMLGADTRKLFRTLTYRKLEGLNKVVLRFYENKLVQIVFDYDLGKKEKKLTARELSENLGADFLLFEGAAKGTRLSDFENQKQPSIPRVYEVLYTLISVKPNRFYFVTMQNNNSKAFWRSIAGKPTSEMYPGHVSELQIISRSLEKQ